MATDKPHPQPSPFLDPGPSSTPSALGIIHLKRDLLVPTILTTPTPSTTSDYAEGIVTNTRFGSFPHTTLLSIPWGTQVRASKVDTGSRGNKDRSKKRKRAADPDGTPAESGDAEGDDVKAAVVASTGFAHLLPPTPEAWTLSLPHRTQVVYTPDYSYVLQRLRVRPGDTIIEAGAGSGSFSHAAARAVFSGYPWEDTKAEQHGEEAQSKKRRKRKLGRVLSFEYHEPRARKLREEISAHGLDTVVHVTHRDVYQDGFCLAPETTDSNTASPPTTNADAIFLDLPAPWLALQHLSRSAPPPPTLSTPDAVSQSPLNPRTTTRICTFSPCIEQVTKTVSALREHGWADIDMVEIAQRRIDVRRERVGLVEEGLRGANPTPANVAEALARLRKLEARHLAHRQMTAEEGKKAVSAKNSGTEGEGQGKEGKEGRGVEARKLWKEGRLVHRTESELKTHTSYLVFAVLPREWSTEDEARCAREWPVAGITGEAETKKLKTR